MMGCFGGKRNEKDKIQNEKNKEIEKSLEEERKKIKSTHSLLILGKYTSEIYPVLKNTVTTLQWKIVRSL